MDTALNRLLEQNIRTAVDDYFRHSSSDGSREIRDDISEHFIERLAVDAARGKRDLRNLLRKSPSWDEHLQAVIINGTRTHDPDYAYVSRLAHEITDPWTRDKSRNDMHRLDDALRYFSRPNVSDNVRDLYISAIKELAPNAYRPRRKKSRIFKSLCDALGVTDESAGSDFQKLFAKFADELYGKKLTFKLFLSINPAHFLTMSNPKCDNRGDMLTSCHSFNSTGYEYNCGCTGYARDDVTMIAFTVDNPDNPETLNNRKTSRQLFMYKVDGGVLLQSRMYNTGGGTYGAQKESILYRDLVQRELSALEGVPNLWKTEDYVANKRHIYFDRGFDFGGYPDWEYINFNPKLSVRLDHDGDAEGFAVGTAGLCIKCGTEINEGLYCKDCDDSQKKCDWCGEYHDEDNLRVAYDRYGEEILICNDCFENDFGRCDLCEAIHPFEYLRCLENGEHVCSDCFESDCECCNDCGAAYYDSDLNTAFDREDNEVRVCDDCLRDNYDRCDACGNYFHEDTLTHAVNSHGDEVWICDYCRANHYETCDKCGKVYHESLMRDGMCPICRARVEEESE